MLDQLLAKLESWGDDLVLMLPNLAAALGVIALFWLLGRLAGAGVRRLMDRFDTQKSLDDLVRKLVRFIVTVVGFIIALSILQLDKAATTFLAGAGVIGIALGFAFQDLSANFIAGVVLAVRRPLRIGDLVETNEYFGTIERIRLRSTWLRTPDGKRIMIPNRKVFEEAVTNYTLEPDLRVDVECGVSYGDDLERVRDVALEAVRGVDRLEHRDVELYFTEFGSSSINFVVRFWIEFRQRVDYLAAQSSAVMAIKRAFDENDITIPFPIRTLDFGIVGGETLAQHLDGTPSEEQRAA